MERAGTRGWNKGSAGSIGIAQRRGRDRGQGTGSIARWQRQGQGHRTEGRDRWLEHGQCRKYTMRKNEAKYAKKSVMCFANKTCKTHAKLI